MATLDFTHTDVDDYSLMCVSITVVKENISKIEMFDNDNNDLCVRFYLVTRNNDTGKWDVPMAVVDIPCFYIAGFTIGDNPEFVVYQLEKTREFINEHN